MIAPLDRLEDILNNIKETPNPTNDKDMGSLLDALRKTAEQLLKRIEKIRKS
jgi:hypothetical protein